MEPSPEVEALREQIQRNHYVHVEAELAVTETSLRNSQINYETGARSEAAKSLSHAWQALDGARRGIKRITSERERATLSAQYERIEGEVRDFAAKAATEL